MVAPDEVIDKLVQIKQGADLHTSTFTQMVAYEVARGGFLDRHVRVIRKVYGERRDAMLAALKAHFPPGVRWTQPQGGLFLWVTLPAGLDSAELLARGARRRRWPSCPARRSSRRGGGADTLRLNFSYCTPQKIEEGIRRLGERAAPRTCELGARPCRGERLVRAPGVRLERIAGEAEGARARAPADVAELAAAAAAPQQVGGAQAPEQVGGAVRVGEPRLTHVARP